MSIVKNVCVERIATFFIYRSTGYRCEFIFPDVPNSYSVIQSVGRKLLQFLKQLFVGHAHDKIGLFINVEKKEIAGDKDLSLLFINVVHCECIEGTVPEVTSPKSCGDKTPRVGDRRLHKFFAIFDYP